jgi:hypothetical protein
MPRPGLSRNTLRRVVTSAALAAGAMGHQAVRGEVIVSDRFGSDYTLGALHGQSGGYGWAAGSSWAVNATLSAGFATVAGVNGVSEPTLQYQNGAVSIDGGSQALRLGYPGSAGVVDNAFNRALPAQLGTLYFSFLLKNVGTLETTAGTSDFLQFGLANSPTTINGSATINTGASSNGNTLQARIRTTTGNDSSTIGSGTMITAYTTGTTYLVVGKLSKVSGSTNYNNLLIYLNPSTLTETGAPNMTITSSSGFLDVAGFIGRVARLDSDDVNLLDEIRVGTTYADVVPEPGGVAALGAIAAGLALRRRRRAGTVVSTPGVNA